MKKKNKKPREVKIVTQLHNSVKREYSKYMSEEKPKCMTEAKKYGKNFFDGERKYGYGGYYYIDGRWDKIIDIFEKIYLKKLPENFKLLDAGCGKGFFLKDLKKRYPLSRLYGYDISKYAINKSDKKINYNLFVHDALKKTKFSKTFFDVYTAFGLLHNFKINQMKFIFDEINRISKKQYIWVESYRNDKELYNLQCWARTADSFFDPDEWRWIFKNFEYTGDYEFIYFN